MSDFDLEIKKEFLIEALMNLGEVDVFFKALDSSTDSKSLLEKMFFVAHNLKGGSLSVGFNEIAEFTNQLESLVLKIKNGEIDLNKDVISTLLRSNKRLVEMLSGLQDNLSATFDNKDFMVDLQSCYSKTSKMAN